MFWLFTVPASQIYQISNSCFSGVFSGSILEFLGESNSDNGVGSTEMRNKMKFNELWPRTLIALLVQLKPFYLLIQVRNSGYNTLH